MGRVDASVGKAGRFLDESGRFVDVDEAFAKEREAFDNQRLAPTCPGLAYNGAVIVECPGCHTRYDIPPRPAGTRVRCRCRTVFAVPKAGGAAGVLRCPKCGAACDPGAAACGYCHAPLATATCPRCFGRAFQGNRFCPHCGAELDAAAPAPAGEGQRVCPRCQPAALNHLTAHVVSDTLLDECHACGGLWVDAHAFERVVADRDRQAVLLETGLVPPAPEAPAGPMAPVRYLPCPDCHVLMNRKNFGERSGVIIEVCKPHGLWFDRDQLGRALRFVMSGGLEEAKRRKLADLDSALARKQAQLDGDAPTGLGVLNADVYHANPHGPAVVGEAVLNLLGHLFG